jgi:hypothetical protein
MGEAIEIRWPSGINQVLKDVREDQIVQVDERQLGGLGRRARSEYYREHRFSDGIRFGCSCILAGTAPN